MHVLDASEGAIELEDHDHGKAPPGRIVEKLAPPYAMGKVVCGSQVDVDIEDVPLLSSTEVPERHKLRFGVLHSITGADPGVDSYPGHFC